METNATKLAAFMNLTVKVLTDMVGGLSKPSKMPGYGYSIPASLCKTGGYLQTVDDSVCSDCYACKGRYKFGNVQKALTIRALRIEEEDWPFAMAALILKKYRNVRAFPDRVFRWHDAGDIQNRMHLAKICLVAEMTPTIAHWLPTKEYKMVYQHRQLIPDNLTVRISAPMKGKIENSWPDPDDTHALRTIKGNYARAANVFPIATVDGEGEPCPAASQGNSCGSCRKCWNPDVNVSYPSH